MEEKEIVLLVKQGDEDAFKTLIDNSLPKLKNLIQNQYRLSTHDLDDIVQISTIKAWQKIAAFRGDSTFVTWFFIILRNETLNFIKKKYNIDSHELTAQPFEESEGDYENILHSSLDDQLDENARTIVEKRETMKLYKDIIEEVLKKLKPTHSQIIKMVLEEDKSYKEIAEALNIPMGTVMSRLFFARKNAQKLITQYAKRDDLQLTCLGRRQ